MDRQKVLSGAPGHLNPVPQNKTNPPDFAMIIVMIIVLGIILLFCFWGAPGIRAYCRRKCCCRCPINEPRERSSTPGDDRSATPTIILLPFGRMLVVDRTVITQLQADQTGIDFMELSANLIRAHHLRYSSTPSILDSDTTSKGISPISLGYSPPSYEDIFGEKNNDLPPSYSELSLLFRQRQMESNEMQTFNFRAVTARDEGAIQETILDIGEEQTCEEQPEGIAKDGHVAISVPSSLQCIDLPSAGNSDCSYPNCKYCIMSLGSDRRTKIKCYCYEDAGESGNECVLMARDACNSTAAVDNRNHNECSAYTVERVTDDPEELSEINCKDEKDSGDASITFTTNAHYSNEEERRKSFVDIRESSL